MSRAPAENPKAGFRSRNQGPNASFVREMFGRIAPRYDLLNHLLSMQVDRWWRRKVARRFRQVLQQPGARALDLCCGTADLALALAGVAHSTARIVGADFCHPMLERARDKLHRRSLPPLLAEANALVLPFPDDTFHLVTTGFGFRNLSDYAGGLEEMLRVLAPGGQVGILEFSRPISRLFGSLYDIYFHRLLPRIGGAVSGDSGAYRYLVRSVSEFPSPEGLAGWMREAGFVGVEFEKLTGGTACLHTGQKPKGSA